MKSSSLQSFLLSARYSQLAHMLRSEEHTSELQSRLHLVCRLLLEKKKNNLTQLTRGDYLATYNQPERHVCSSAQNINTTATVTTEMSHRRLNARNISIHNARRTYY